jgi:hypothetical protein
MTFQNGIVSDPPFVKPPISYLVHADTRHVLPGFTLIAAVGYKAAIYHLERDMRVTSSDARRWTRAVAIIED